MSGRQEPNPRARWGQAIGARWWASLAVGLAVLGAGCGSEEIAGPVTGSLQVAVTGLAAGQDAGITVTGPGGFTRAVPTSTTLVDLVPGQYTVTAIAVADQVATYAPALASQPVTVIAQSAPATVDVAYALASGSLALSVNGLPAGTAADVTISGPGGYQAAVTADSVLRHLDAGNYTLTAAAVSDGNGTYEPAAATQVVTVSPSLVDLPVAVNYALSSGTLDVMINGLPAGTDADVSVSGPNYATVLTGSSTLTGLQAATYTIDARNVSDGVLTYVPNPETQAVAVPSAATASATVTYAVSSPSTLNLSIDGLYLTQSVQTYSGAVPLVADRDGFLRVFVTANQPNTASPAVRVRLYQGGTLVNTFTIPAPGAMVPTSVDESDLSQSWNLDLPAGMLQTNLEILADVDPGNAVIEQDETDNNFPVSGTPAALDVRSIGTFMVRFVPVEQSINGLTGNVSAGNVDQFLDKTQKIFPLVDYDADIRATYTYTDTIPIEQDNATGTWSRVLSEINALRTADGSSRYYYGVVRVNYSSGIAGIAYVPGKAAVGWDNLPSASGIAAHELGHNWGRGHAPCGGAPNPDPFYPYPGGQIGVYGYDRSTGALKAPSTPDIMGYCANDWVSDYTYSNVLSHISTRFGSAQTGAATERVLLVWGRVRNGTIELEPAFEIDGQPSLPSGGRYTVEGYSSTGATAFRYRFDPVPVADGATGGGEGQFAFTLPAPRQSLARLRISGPATAAVRSATGSVRAPPGAPGPSVQQAALEAAGPDRVRLRWDHRQHPMVLVREASTGRILSFARGGVAIVRSADRELELVYSDGVRSTTMRQSVSGR